MRSNQTTSGFAARKKKDGLLRIMSNGSGSTPVNMPFASPTNTGVSTGRKVNTMPPSAIWDPPTPPLPPIDQPAPTTPQRPRNRIRYSTSESGSSDEPNSSDDEVPWWTFTNKGMMKMRQRTMRRKPEEDSTADSAKEDRKGKRKIVSRKSSKSDDPARKSSKDEPARKFSNDEPSHKPSKDKPPSLHLGPPLAPSPVRARSHFTPDLHSLWRRSSGHTPDEVQSDSEIPRRRVFARSNSAPGSAALDTIEASPHPLSSIVVPNPVTAEPIPITPVESDPVLSRHVKRQMTAPFPRFRRLRTETGHVSDSEATVPRVSKRMQSSLGRSHPPTNSPNDSPSAPRPRRLNTTALRNQLEPISQHFAHGWPHAGSWQDALYGRYEGKEAADDARDREVSGETLVAEPEPEPQTRRKTRRTRRYRQALMPPTPKGLGFSPQDDNADRWKEGKVNQTEFDWNSPSTANPSRHAPHPTGSTIAEADELSRQPTRMTEKEPAKKAPVKRTGRTKREGEDWKTRWKRMMFLDARLTIFLRIMDIAVVATLLALSITIRQELINLRLPGMIGPSTTLTISFAAFTLFHATTAIYREYFGKPIGLWGLRSKMLWICLDLLFIALWSSALTLATNDYIATPLECTRDDPWWLPGLRTTYAQLLEDLAGSGDITGVTGADLIKATLGIVLPEQIIQAPLTREICRRQTGCIALSLFALLLYAGNMVLSLFRIFETVRRSANVGRAIMV